MLHLRPMGASNHQSNPQKTALVFKPGEQRDIDHHKKEWTSGTRGGGSIPADFGWPTNPKQLQEENGSGIATAPISK